MGPDLCLTRVVKTEEILKDFKRAKTTKKVEFVWWNAMLGGLGVPEIFECLSCLQYNYVKAPSCSNVLSIDYRVLYCRTVVVVEVQRSKIAIIVFFGVVSDFTKTFA